MAQERERERVFFSLAGLYRLPSRDSVDMKWNKISITDDCCWKEITEIAFEMIDSRLIWCSKAAWFMYMEEAYAHTAWNRKYWTRIVKIICCVYSWITCGMLTQISLDYDWCIRFGVPWILKNPLEPEVGMDGKVGQLTWVNTFFVKVLT